MPRSIATLAVLLILETQLAWANDAAVSHGIAMHGDLKYGPDFAHLEYVNPEAPKGGEVRLSAVGTFDTLNGYTLRGVAASGLGLIFDTLLYHSSDEAFSEYGLLAESVEVPDDRSWVAFTLRPQARFHDGTPVTVDDVIYTLETLKTKGHPFYRSYYGSVDKAEQVADRKVRFHFTGGENRELPLIIGQMPVFSKRYWADREFDATTLEAPLGNGPYRVSAVDPGRSVTYERIPDYWGSDLPINRGRFNFGRIRIDYYRDRTVALEAFKAGEFDFHQETNSKEWATAYDVPAVRDGRIVLEEIPHENPTGMQAFVFNTRKPIFEDRRVREALGYAFDFEWTNEHLFYGSYARTASYFSNSELASTGLPTPEELAILEPFRDRLPADVFEREYKPPVTDGSGNIRGNLRAAIRLLKEAGWTIRDQRLTNVATGQAMEFEMLLVNPAFERVVLPFKKNLERLGIAMKVRTVDSAQYQKRTDDFDFDMIIDVFGQSLSPGNEQRDFWSSDTATRPGSRNTAGIRDPVVDELIELVISAPDRQALVHRTRVLDRALLWGHYLIPNWHSRNFRVAYWNKFGRPEINPKYALGFLDTWWVDPKKAARLAPRATGEATD